MYQEQEYVIVAKAVEKTFYTGFWKKKYTHALRGVDLTVKKGEIFGLLGPNGAGKTTLLNIFSGQLLPDSGQVWILGEEITKNTNLKIKTRLNMCSGNPNFPWSLTVEENLRFYALLYGLCTIDCRNMVDNCVAMFELEEYRQTKYEQLSTGNKQKLALAKAFINQPEILFLDEPTLGLDPDIAKKIRELILKIREENRVTIILTTHYMREAEELCARIAFIKDGEIKALGTRDELMQMTKTANLEEVFLELVE